MNKKTKLLCINGMGIALFVILSMCLRVPIFQNYYVCLGYIVMTLYLYSIGTISGTIVGVIGTILYCFLINGLRGMPGWALGNIAIGIILGLYFKWTKILRIEIKEPCGALSKYDSKKLSILLPISDIITISFAVAIGILGIKSITECILYAQPFIVRATINMSAFIADLITIIIAIPLCKRLDIYIKKFV